MTLKTELEQTPHFAIHPGVHLQKELLARGIKQNEFAHETGILPSHLNEIVKGKRSITPEMALTIGEVLEHGAKYWNDLQADYNLDTAKIEKANLDRIEAVKSWQIIKQYIPVSYFKKENELTGNLKTDVQHLLKIHNAVSVHDLGKFSSSFQNIHFKKSSKLTEHVNFVNSWIFYVKFLSQEQKASGFSPNFKDEIIHSLKKIFLGRNIIDNLTNTLNKFGIKVIVKPKPDHAPLDGAALWHNGSPIIGLTLRHRRLDNLVFTVYHELAHIFYHLSEDKLASFVDNFEDRTGYTSSDFEAEANDFARNTIIPKDHWQAFISHHSSFKKAEVEEFAKINCVPTASVYGRLCFEGIMKYSDVAVHSVNNQII